MAKSRAKPRKNGSATKGKEWHEKDIKEKPLFKVKGFITEKDRNGELQKRLMMGSKPLLNEKDKREGVWEQKDRKAGLFTAHDKEGLM